MDEARYEVQRETEQAIYEANHEEKELGEEEYSI